VNITRLTRAISRRFAIARRRRRALLLIDAIKYAFQPRPVLAGVGAHGGPRHRAVESSKFSYGIYSGRTKTWLNSTATVTKPSRCSNGVRDISGHETSYVFAAIYRATFWCTSRRRHHRGLLSACAWRPPLHACSGQLVSLTRRSWSESISPITCKIFQIVDEKEPKTRTETGLKRPLQAVLSSTCKTDVRTFSLGVPESGQRFLSGFVSIRLDLESSRIQGL
jgi:hypothetical protein